MSIADKITQLQSAKAAIASAITAKGGTVASGDGFADFATDIASIPSGNELLNISKDLSVIYPTKVVNISVESTDS